MKLEPGEYSADDLEGPGIYIIYSLLDDRCYVGRAVRLRSRFGSHLASLIKGTHSNTHLRNFCKKYGVASLEFGILELCEKEKLIEREQYYLDTFRTGFNISKDATGGSVNYPLGVKKSAEHRKKIGLAHKGKIVSAETRAKISAAKKGKSTSMKGRHVSAEVTARRLAAGKKHSAETIAKIVAANRGRHHTDEAKAKISASGKGRRAWNAGKKLSPEHIEKVSASLRGRRLTSEHVRKIQDSRSRTLLNKKLLKQQIKISPEIREAWEQWKQAYAQRTSGQ